jgi:hypothetical protein
MRNRPSQLGEMVGNPNTGNPQCNAQRTGRRGDQPRTPPPAGDGSFELRYAAYGSCAIVCLGW